MLARIFFIAAHYWKTTFLHRNVFIFALAMPLIFTFVLSTVIGGGREVMQWPIAVVDEDHTALSQALQSRLQTHSELNLTTDLVRSDALLQTEKDEFVATLVIVPGFGQTLTSGQTLASDQTPRLALFTSPTQMRAGQTVEQAVRAAASELMGIARAASISTHVAEQLNLFANGAADRASYFAAGLGQAEAAWSSQPPIVVRAVAVTRLSNANTVPNGFDQSSPGMLVTFALVFLLNGISVLILERQQGTLRRLLVMPMPKGVILFGKVTGIFAAGLVQAAILILFGQFVFGVPWGQAPLALALMVIALAFAITSLGMMIAGIARTYAQAAALSNILMYSIAALGGAWWPIEITPLWMQQIAKFTPTYWAMQGFQDIITRGFGVQAVLPEFAVLVGFGALFLSIGVWRFRYE